MSGFDSIVHVVVYQLHVHDGVTWETEEERVTTTLPSMHDIKGDLLEKYKAKAGLFSVDFEYP